MELTLSSEFSRSGSLFSLWCSSCRFWLSLYNNLMIWSDGFVPFCFGQGGLGVPADCSFCGATVILSCSPGLVYLKFFAASFCWFSTDLGSTNKFLIGVLLHLSHSQLVLLKFSSTPSFLLSHTIWHTWEESSNLFSYFSIWRQWISGKLLLSRNGTVDDLAKQNLLLQPSAVPCSLSFLASRTLWSLIQTKGILFQQNFWHTYLNFN